MGALFTKASSQYLVNSSPPFTGFPFTIGMWMHEIAIPATQTFWSMADAANTTHYFKISSVSGVPSDIRFVAAAGGTAANATISNPGAGWGFLVARAISATNRRLSYTGFTTLSASNATSLTPVVNTQYLGCKGGSTPSEFHEGSVAEFWMTNTDIQPDGGDLSLSTLRHLARCGPFSIPAIARDLVEYRSFRYSMSSEQDRGDEYFGNVTRQTWVNTNGVIRGMHAPLNEGIYRRPGDFVRPGVV